MRTKWVAEQLVQQAAARGLSTTIFRPGTIAGHASTGAFNPDDFVCVLIKGCIELGAAPAVDAAVNLVPVDYVSRALVRVALAAAPGRYHLVGADAVAWTDLVRWLRELGYPLAELPYAAWRRRVLERARATASSLVPLLPLFAEHEDDRLAAACRHYDDAATRAALAGSGIACAPVDAALLRRYVERFVAAATCREPADERTCPGYRPSSAASASALVVGDERRERRRDRRARPRRTPGRPRHDRRAHARQRRDRRRPRCRRGAGRS